MLLAIEITSFNVPVSSTYGTRLISGANGNCPIAARTTKSAVSPTESDTTYTILLSITLPHFKQITLIRYLLSLQTHV
ncbi:hypothetical protein protein [Bacillus cereus G9241]|nr:hypothetical protein protein [Bacillus cereus G9241]